MTLAKSQPARRAAAFQVVGETGQLPPVAELAISIEIVRWLPSMSPTAQAYSFTLTY